jgi:hypothetical protein
MGKPMPSTAPQVKPEPPSPPKTYTQEERQAYQKKMAKELQKLQQRFGDLKPKTQEVPPQKKRMALRTMGEAERRYYYAKQKFTVLEAAPEKDWGRRKVEFEKALAGLNQAVKALEALL